MADTQRSFVTRVRERFRYGLMTQEALDRLGRRGIIYCPYYLVEERALAEPETDADPERITFAKLAAEQAALVAGMPCRPVVLERVVDRMRTTICYGVFDGADLVGYSWADFRAVTVPLTSNVLFELGARGAYLLDMYVARTHRGKRLAPWLRYRVYREVMSEGRTSLYSVTLAHNESSRRFKRRLGAVEIEKRLLVGVKSILLRDMRLRALTRDALPSPPSLTVRAEALRG